MKNSNPTKGKGKAKTLTELAEEEMGVMGPNANPQELADSLKDCFNMDDGHQETGTTDVLPKPINDIISTRGTLLKGGNFLSPNGTIRPKENKVQGNSSRAPVSPQGQEGKEMNDHREDEAIMDGSNRKRAKTQHQEQAIGSVELTSGSLISGSLCNHGLHQASLGGNPAYQASLGVGNTIKMKSLGQDLNATGQYVDDLFNFLEMSGMLPSIGVLKEEMYEEGYTKLTRAVGAAPYTLLSTYCLLLQYASNVLDPAAARSLLFTGFRHSYDKARQLEIDLSEAERARDQSNAPQLAAMISSMNDKISQLQDSVNVLQASSNTNTDNLANRVSSLTKAADDPSSVNHHATVGTGAPLNLGSPVHITMMRSDLRAIKEQDTFVVTTIAKRSMTLPKLTTAGIIHPFCPLTMKPLVMPINKDEPMRDAHIYIARGVNHTLLSMLGRPVITAMEKGRSGHQEMPPSFSPFLKASAGTPQAFSKLITDSQAEGWTKSWTPQEAMSLFKFMFSLTSGEEVAGRLSNVRFVFNPSSIGSKTVLVFTAPGDEVTEEAWSGHEGMKAWAHANSIMYGMMYD